MNKTLRRALGVAFLVAMATTAASQSPGPPRDGDADGVPDSADSCPTSPNGGAAIVPGCTALDVFQQPSMLALPTLSILSDIATSLRRNPDMAGVVGEMDEAARGVDDAVAQVLAGDACGGADTLRRAGMHFDFANDLLDDMHRAAEAELLRAGGADDVTIEDSAALGIRFWRRRVGRARGAADDLAEAFSRACRFGPTASLDRGVVRRTSDDLRRIELADGRIVGLADPLDASDQSIYPGRGVVLRGVSFGDGTELATGIAQDNAGAAGTEGVGILPCVRFRIAPVQGFGYFAVEPLVLHDPLGYKLANGSYLLEEGMRLAAVASPCNAAPGTHSSLRVSYSWTHPTTGITKGPFVIALDLDETDQPVILPVPVKPPATGLSETITVQARRCLTAAPPSDDGCVILSTTSYAVKVGARASMAKATYGTTRFAVNDQVPGDWNLTSVTSWSQGPGPDWTWDVGTSPAFFAQGHRYVAFAPDAATTTFGAHELFGIFNSDYYPVLGTDVIGAWAGLMGAGVTHATGLRWPRVQGTSHGKPFRYSAELPQVVRDVVSFCAGPVDTLYKLPFKAGTIWPQGQGSLSGGTHGQGYAYDMGAPCGTTILAARGGWVVDLDEGQSVQFKDSCPSSSCIDPDFIPPGCVPGCPGHGCSSDEDAFWRGNVAWIRHQDGSYGQYVHMPLDGIVPQVDTAIRRGAVIGIVGVTGRSTGPHLHIAEKTDPSGEGCVMSSIVGGGCTRLMLYQRGLLNGVQNCYEPTSGDAMLSTNQQQP